jgi:tetratricopeptide (TPR) repeat protein
MKKIKYLFLIALLPIVLTAAQENFFAKFGANLAAYFNTFYNAKVLYNEAQELYNEEEDKEKITTKTRSALNRATNQAEIVIAKHANSSYVDDAMFFNSVCQFQLGRYERALSQLEELTLQYPDSPYYFEAKLWISKCYFQMGKKTIAYDLIEQFLANIKNKGYFSEAYSLMGYLALQEEDKSKAIDAFLQAADMASDKEPRCNMYLEAVDLLIDDKNYNDALKYTDRANRNIKFDEQRARVQIAYIRIYRLQGDKQKATEFIEEGLKDSRLAQYWGDILFEQANIYFIDKEPKEAVSKLRYIVQDPENIYRRNKDSEAWAKAAYRLGEYYLYEDDQIDSCEFYFNQAKTKRRQSEEGQLADDYLEKVKQLKKINKNIETLVKKAPSLADSAWVNYEYLADSSASEIMAREILLGDTLHLDSVKVDSLTLLVKNKYHRFEKALSSYLETSNEYVGELFSLAGLFLFDLGIPDTALNIYKRIVNEFYYTPSIPQALYSQSYVWEYEFSNKLKADSIKQEITEKYPGSEISNYILDLVPQDSILHYEYQDKIYQIESKYIDNGEFQDAIIELKSLLKDIELDNKNHAFIAYKIAWLYDYEISASENTQDSTMFYYHIVVRDHPGTPLARKSALRIAAIETDISDYLAMLAGDSLKTDDVNIDSTLYSDQNEDDDEKEIPHPIYRRLKSPGRPRPVRL